MPARAKIPLPPVRKRPVLIGVELKLVRLRWPAVHRLDAIGQKALVALDAFGRFEFRTVTIAAVTAARHVLADVDVLEPGDVAFPFAACGCREPGHLMRPARIRGRARRVGLVEGRGWPCRDLAGRLRAVADPVIGEAGAC